MSKVAIIGFSFRFPSTNREQFWNDLLAGRDLVTQVASDRWSHTAFYHPSRSHPGTSYTFAAGSLGDVAGFDADFFGISPREAAIMDPQQRLLLELSWEAFEDAGLPPSKLKGRRCGVFIGISSSDYAYRMAEDLAVLDSSVATGNTACIAANRLSYFYDLRGPSYALDTACSSSLVAFHHACRSIASGESDHALVGGVSLHLHPFGFISFSKASMLSRQGRCRVFDASGDGYVRSEGGGIFLLKDYEQALADGDRILAVVAHTAVNTDGHKSGITVPSYEAQADLLRQAYEEAGIKPNAIDYVEAHGTGTAVGDPIESRSLGLAIGSKRSQRLPLPIGSVKSNLGHLETASGVAGLVKTIYALRNRVVPATIGLKALNPHIKFDEWNLQVVRNNQPLKNSGTLTIGVNSFGFGGANAHAILQSFEGQTTTAAPIKHKALPLIISAQSKPALQTLAESWANFMETEKESQFYDLAYASFNRRDPLSHRAMVFANNRADAKEQLRQFSQGDSTQITSGIALQAPGQIAFVYSGNGSQWAGMGKELLKNPCFKKAIRRIDRLYVPLAGYALEDEFAGKLGENRYQRTEFAQPALFALQIGITEMLQTMGVEASAVVGHSVGEVAAAWACGALSLQEAIVVVYHRSRLQALTQGAGQMTAVALDAQTARGLLLDLGLSGQICIAGINSPSGVTLAGKVDSLVKLEAALASHGIFYKRLDLDYAFHSCAMDCIASKLLTALVALRPKAARIPFFSTVTAGKLDGNQLDAQYWWHNVREPVLFADAVRQMILEDHHILVEIGPHPVLKNYLSDCLKGTGIEGRVISTAARLDGHPSKIYQAAAHVQIAGAKLNLKHCFPRTGGFQELPTYPWQRERHWHPVTTESHSNLNREFSHPLLGYALKQQELCFENCLDLLKHPTLADHVVGESTVFPGTGFVELALAASNAWLQGDFAEIHELEIQAPLLLGAEHAKTVRVAIDGQDGSFTVKAREFAGNDAMLLHARGRILREPATAWSRQRTSILPRRPADFDGVSHSQALLDAGFAYGPSYCAIGSGWIESDSVQALFQIPESIKAELTTYHLHPALLDSAFQLIIHLRQDWVSQEEGFAYVPSKIGKILFHSGQGVPHLATMMLRRHSASSVLADFQILDASGVLIASVLEVRFRSIRLKKGTTAQIQSLAVRSIPMPLPIPTGGPSILTFEQVKSTLSEAIRRCVLKGVLRTYADEIDPLLDTLCARFVLEALSPGRLGYASNFESAAYLSFLRGILQEDGLRLNPSDNQLSEVNSGSTVSAQDIWNSLIADYPDYFKIIHVVGRVGLNLQGLLEGKITLEQICPRDGMLSMLRRQMLGEHGKHTVSQAIADLLRTGLADLTEGARLRFLEVAEGSPCFASNVLPVIVSDQFDYGFASSNPQSLEEARRLKEKFPHLKIYDLNEVVNSVELTNPSRESYQLALLSTDTLKLENLLSATEFASSCLCQGGTLALLGQFPSRWVDFVFGSRPDWWSQGSQGIKSRQLMPQHWIARLGAMGYSGMNLLEFSPSTETGSYLLLSRLDNKSLNLAASSKTHLQPERWLVLADSSGYSAALAERLSNELSTLGKEVRWITQADGETSLGLFQDILTVGGAWEGILYLSGLNDAAKTNDGNQKLQTLSSRCLNLGALAMAGQNLGLELKCWIVTAGAMTDTLPNRKTLGWRTTTSSFSDSVVWGFTRSLSNEFNHFSARLVDLEDPYALETVTGALLGEFFSGDDEREIIIAGKGERFVTRLRNLHGFKQTPKVPAEELPLLHLGFHAPGQLRNLQWEEQTPSVLEAGYVEIEVHATGLNFRDVMFSLGLLTEEAVENGFAGPTLGLEFSGLVVGIGAGVDEFAIGDRVVGFGPSSFANRVVTKAGAVAPIPSGLSFEAAATIPSTFFTAYYALQHLAGLEQGDRVLIHGAAGGVGLAAIQVAKWRGAEIYTTAGTEEKRDFLRLLGINHVYDSRSLSFAEEIMADTQGEGVNVILNSLAGEAINRNLSILKPFGRFLELGKRDFYENLKIGLRPFRNNISYFGIDADQLMLNQPKLTKQLFGKVIDLFNEGILHPLPYCAFEAENVIDAFRYMQQSKQIGKVIVTYRNGIPCYKSKPSGGQNELRLQADATYLVTGGLSGFGLQTARWLAGKGARQLVLVSRSGALSEEAISAIHEMEQKGAKVLATACDVSNQLQLKKLLGEIAQQLPPLKGVVHAAAVIEDGLVQGMTERQFKAVLEPKILGAQNLHELTLDLPLDYFILYSSATTLFGNPGQSNYVAANTWLEALARHRKIIGLPVTCVLWGAINDVGYLARNPKLKEHLQSRMGGTPISSSVALNILEILLINGQSDIGVLEYDWRALSKLLSHPKTPKFTEFSQRLEISEPAETGSWDIQKLLAELPEQELQEQFVDMVKTEVSDILKLPKDRIDPARPLQTMGLDSLMGIELVSAMENRFGIKLPVMALSENPSIEKLALRIIHQLRNREESETTGKNLSLSQHAHQVVAIHAPHVSPEDVEKFAENLDLDTLKHSLSLVPSPKSSTGLAD